MAKVRNEVAEQKAKKQKRQRRQRGKGAKVEASVPSESEVEELKEVSSETESDNQLMGAEQSTGKPPVRQDPDTNMLFKYQDAQPQYLSSEPEEEQEEEPQQEEEAIGGGVR